MSVQQVIERLEALPKQGESYDSKGRHGWRNPIRGDTGALLQALVLAKAPKRVLEFGTAYGLSGCYIASKLTDGSKMVSVEWDAPTAEEAQKNFDEATLPVRVLCGDAMNVIKLLATSGEKFDLVFLDANKDGYYEQYQELARLNLLAPGCLILADNVIDRASEMQNFLDLMESLGSIIINTECGLLVVTV